MKLYEGYAWLSVSDDYAAIPGYAYDCSINSIFAFPLSGCGWGSFDFKSDEVGEARDHRLKLFIRLYTWV